MHLNTVNRSIEALLSGAVAATQPVVVASWVDMTATAAPVGGMTPTTMNGVTAVTIVAAPAASAVRKVSSISLINLDIAAVTATVRFNDNGTPYKIYTATLAVGDMLGYSDAAGWFVLDSAGQLKSVATGGIGRLLKFTALTSGTSHTTQPGTTSGLILVQAGGGGGGGSASSVAQAAAGGGGASGGWFWWNPALVGNTAYAYAIGGGGGGGAAGANDGSAGSNSTWTVGATTATANGGLGGKGHAASAAAGFALGGAAPAVSTNGTVNATGNPGGPSNRESGTVACSGFGASSQFGGGGNSLITQSDGAVATGYGSGGSGGCTLNGGGAQAGGNGSGGIILVWEYS